MRPLGTGWLTSEFWVALAGLAAKIVTFVYVLRTVSFIDPSGEGVYLRAITDIVAAIGALVAISHGTANYVNNRTSLKAEAVRSQAATAARTQVIDRRV